MPRARGAWAVAVALLAAAAMTVLLGWSPTLDPVDAVMGRGAVTRVPDLSGLSRPRAVADVESAGLEANVDTAFSLTEPRGAVVAQDPAPGTRRREGSEVRIVVSRGVSRVDMPDAVGRPISEVVVGLDAAGVDYAVERVASELVATDVVIEQSPEPGVLVTAADPVRFVVSTGPEPRPVPDVTGLSAEGAAYSLGRSGFTIGEVVDAEDSQRPPGSVISTDPPAGEVEPRDTVVTLKVSVGPPPVAVPDVAGRTVDAAVAALESVGLVANVVGGGAGPTSVSAQQPGPGTSLRPGSLVTLEVGGG